MRDFMLIQSSKVYQISAAFIDSQLVFKTSPRLVDGVFPEFIHGASPLSLLTISLWQLLLIATHWIINPEIANTEAYEGTA